MIALNYISKTFGKGTQNETTVLSGFNIDVRENDFIIVVGSNGSGKSTLLNIIAGTTLPDTGEVVIDGKNVTKLPDYSRSKWIARIFQNPLAGTAPDLTVLENFRLAARRTKSKGLQTGISDQFKRTVKEKISELGLGLENKLNQTMGTLSGGQRQALTLMMATMDETKLLLLDEPVAALDPKTSSLIMELTKSVIERYKLTALLVTHQVKDVITYGNRAIQLKEGKIIRDLDIRQKNELQMNEVYEWFGH